MTGRLLDGLKVADFTQVYAGSIMTRSLAHHGAQVVKIEGRTRTDVERTHGPYRDDIAGPDRSGTYLELNTGKMDLALNLTKPRAKEVAKRLVAWADLVVENFSGGTMARMGLGYEDLRQVKPDIIMLSTSMQGQTGPAASHPGFGMQLTALAGYDNLVGWPDRDPTRYGVYTDYIVAHCGLLAIMSALDYRARTGKGQYIDLSQFETGVQFLAPYLLDYEVNGRIARRNGNRSDWAAPHGAFRCRGADRWCAIAILADAQWEGFSRVVGNPAWTRDERFATLLGRKANEDELERLVEAWTTGNTAEEVMALMQAQGVPAGLAETIQDSMDNDPQLRQAQFYREVTNPEVGVYRATRPPFTASGAECDVRYAPLLGEHNEYVCKEILGMSDGEIADLVIDGALE